MYLAERHEWTIDTISLFVVLFTRHCVYSEQQLLISISFSLLLLKQELRILVLRAVGVHPFPFRTRPLSPPAPMVVRYRRVRVGQCQDSELF